MAKIVLNRAGVRELLRSDEMQEALREQAETIKARLPDGYETNEFLGKNRRNIEVAAVTTKAKADNLKNNTLLKAVSSK